MHTRSHASTSPTAGQYSQAMRSSMLQPQLSDVFSQCSLLVLLHADGMLLFMYVASQRHWPICVLNMV